MISSENALLLVIDIQGRLTELMHDKDKLLSNAGRLIKAANILNIPTVVTEQAPKKLGTTMPELKDLLLPSAKTIHKESFSSWGCEEIKKELCAMNRSHIIIAGIETHVCVYQTARDLKHFGFNVHVLADVVSSRTEQNRKLAIERMRQEGITISSAEMVICELLKTAQHPKFRDVMAHIK